MDDLQGLPSLLLAVSTILVCTPVTDGMQIRNISPSCFQSQVTAESEAPICAIRRRSGNSNGQRKLSFQNDLMIKNADLINCSFTKDGSNQVYEAVNGRLSLNDQQHVECEYDTHCMCSFRIHGPQDTVFAYMYEVKISHYLYWDSYDYHTTVGIVNSSQPYINIDKVQNRVLLGGILLENSMTFHVNKSFTNDVQEISVNFTAIPDCCLHLEMGCFSASAGYLQTIGWELGRLYEGGIRDCFNFHVPNDHVLMISFVSVDLQKLNDLCIDDLVLYEGSDCQAEKEKEICYSKDFQPTVIKKTVSLRFRSTVSFSKAKTGFRLLFSYHNKSEEPQKLTDNTWNCSVPNYDDFKLHFACTLDPFCSDHRDKVGCQSNDTCGISIEKVGERCYRFFRSTEVSWEEASETCTSNCGYLSSLNTAQEWDDFLDMVQERHFQSDVLVGLQSASITLMDMYQQSWLWSDKTLAVYLQMEYSSSDRFFCGIFDHKTAKLKTVDCNKRIDAAFFCELGTRLDYTDSASAISLHTPKDWLSESMAKCDHDQTTHTFLTCDISTNCTATDKAESLVCLSDFARAGPYFSCDNLAEQIPYTLVCDFRQDCCDGSDESFCQGRACDTREYFQCSDGKQCILEEKECDMKSDCFDGGDEAKCAVSPRAIKFTSILPPAQVDFTGLGNFTVTALNTSSCPDTHFQCPPDGYCLPVYVRCNGVYDCPGGEDEANCDHYTCPNFYRCRGSRVCVHQKHMCDGVFQCPQHDDELFCNFTCPDTCTCYGLAFVCSGPVLLGSLYPDLKYLDASGTDMKPRDLTNNTFLIYLSLRNCNLYSLEELDFPNLQGLDLSNNFLTVLHVNSFHNLANLRYLFLAFNYRLSFNPASSTPLAFPNLKTLSVAGLSIPILNETFMLIFPNVENLNMSGTGLTVVPKSGFQVWKKLHVLELRGCPMDTFYKGVFDGVKNLETVYTDNYKICCPDNLPPPMNPENCYTQTDEVSSCDNLLRDDVYRVFLAFYAVFALVGNLGGFIYRAVYVKCSTRMGYEIFVTHLSVADFLMGVYLAIIGVADRVYYGDYQWNDVAWKQSVACKVAGFLSLVSSEVSALIICIITFERFSVIRFPLRNIRFNMLSAHVASTLLWLVGLIMAMVPLLPDMSDWDFYGQSGICIPLPITTKKFGGSNYAFGIMIVLNFFLFLIIAVGQFLIYRALRRGALVSRDASKDLTIARRLLAVVMTDFLCWFPIGILGIMARSGVPVSDYVNVAMAILILPLNSALNPFLYTFNIVMEKRRQLRSQKRSKSNVKKSNSTLSTAKVSDIEISLPSMTESKDYTKEEALCLFSSFLDKGLLSPKQVRRQIWHIYEGDKNE